MLPPFKTSKNISGTPAGGAFRIFLKEDNRYHPGPMRSSKVAGDLRSAHGQSQLKNRHCAHTFTTKDLSSYRHRKQSSCAPSRANLPLRDSDTSNAVASKCHATSNRCLTSSNKKLLVTGATLLVTWKTDSRSSASPSPSRQGKRSLADGILNWDTCF